MAILLLLELIELADLSPTQASSVKNDNSTFLLLELIFADQLADLPHQ